MLQVNASWDHSLRKFALHREQILLLAPRVVERRRARQSALMAALVLQRLSLRPGSRLVQILGVQIVEYLHLT